MRRLLALGILFFGFHTLAAVPTAEQMKSLKLPPGFKISIFAEAENARQLALSPEGTLYIGSRQAGKVFALPNALNLLKNPAKTPAKAKVIAKGLSMPSGVAVRDGNLYVGALSEIIKYPNIEKNINKKPVGEPLKIKFPTEAHHGWKHIEFGPDGMLYVPVGAPCNICLSDDKIFASITRISLAGTQAEIIAHGVRNTLGLAWHPKTKELWFTDNGRDMWGDDRPGDELNRLTKVGDHFGYPFCHDMGMTDPEFGKNKDCSAKGIYKMPVAALAPHTAALGLMFYTGSQFPETYRNQALVAEHGSWNRTKKMGYRVMMLETAEGTQASGYKPFIEGWLADEKEWGRPVYLLQMPDGSVLLSDDHAGVIYRITYETAQTAQRQ